MALQKKVPYITEEGKPAYRVEINDSPLPMDVIGADDVVVTINGGGNSEVGISGDGVDAVAVGLFGCLRWSDFGGDMEISRRFSTEDSQPDITEEKGQNLRAPAHA